MSQGTTLIAVKQRLKTVLAAAVAADVTVMYWADELATSSLPRKAIWFDEADSIVDIPTMRTGAKAYHETYTIACIVQVLADDGSSQETADTEAAAILQTVQSEIASDPQLGKTITGLQWVKFAGWEHELGQLPNPNGGELGHGSRFTARLAVSARLNPA